MDLSSPRIVVQSPALSLVGLFVDNFSAAESACNAFVLSSTTYRVRSNGSIPIPYFCGVELPSNHTLPAEWQSLQLLHPTFAVFQSIETDVQSPNALPPVFDHHDNNGQRRLGGESDATWRVLAGWSSGGWERVVEAPMFERCTTSRALEVWVPVQRQRS